VGVFPCKIRPPPPEPYRSVAKDPIRTVQKAIKILRVEAWLNSRSFGDQPALMPSSALIVAI
jgi:hypothetical protein